MSRINHSEALFQIRKILGLPQDIPADQVVAHVRETKSAADLAAAVLRDQLEHAGDAVARRRQLKRMVACVQVEGNWHAREHALATFLERGTDAPPASDPEPDDLPIGPRRLTPVTPINPHFILYPIDSVTIRGTADHRIPL